MEERQISIDLDFKASPSFGVSLTTSILDFLLHHRYQIPENFKIFERTLNNINTEEITCFKRLRSINAAKETYERILEIKEQIKSEFTACRAIYLIFGKSIFTASEAYEIHFPPTFDDISQPTFNDASLRRLLLQLTQSDHLLQNCQQMPATNVFVLYNRIIPIETDDLTEIRDFRLNKSCKRFSIKFNDATKFEVFRDFEDILTIDEEKTEAIENEEIVDSWYQSRIYIKGFTDVLVNNKSIWN